jgi:hypothetical protein
MNAAATDPTRVCEIVVDLVDMNIVGVEGGHRHSMSPRRVPTYGRTSDSAEVENSRCLGDERIRYEDSADLLVVHGQRRGRARGGVPEDREPASTTSSATSRVTRSATTSRDRWRTTDPAEHWLSQNVGVDRVVRCPAEMNHAHQGPNLAPLGSP